MNAVILAFWQAVGVAHDSRLTFTLDLAQLVVLGGLIWRLAEMSKAVKDLTRVTGELSDAMTRMGTRVTRLETLDETRRDRRHDDRHDV